MPKVPPKHIISRADYGSTVEDRDAEAPVAPVAAHDGPSAPRTGDTTGNRSREGSDGPSAVQESLLPSCPNCRSAWKNVKTAGFNCEDEWHEC
jgi:hypothetical protein